MSLGSVFIINHCLIYLWDPSTATQFQDDEIEREAKANYEL